jgi:hypothetical protein
MSTHHPALARRILKTLFDGTLGLLLLPTILLMIWGLAELGYNMLPGLLQDLVNWLFGHNGLAPFFLFVAAPFGFPFVGFPFLSVPGLSLAEGLVVCADWGVLAMSCPILVS